MSKSRDIKPTDGRRKNSRRKSIPVKPPPEIDRSNKPALNTAKKSRKKAYAKKAIKNVFGSEVAMFEAIAKKAKEGSYNHVKLLTDIAYQEDTTSVSVNKAPVINFFGSNATEKIQEKTIDVTHKDIKDE